MSGNKGVCVPRDMAEGFRAFLAEQGIDLTVVTDSPGGVRVEGSDGPERRQCQSDVLYVGGWIGCELARAMGPRLGIPIRSVGAILDHLKVKVRNCGLGCFP